MPECRFCVFTRVFGENCVCSAVPAGFHSLPSKMRNIGTFSPENAGKPRHVTIYKCSILYTIPRTFAVFLEQSNDSVKLTPFPLPRHRKTRRTKSFACSAPKLHPLTFRNTSPFTTPKPRQNHTIHPHFYNYPRSTPPNPFPDIPQTTRISPIYPVPLIQVHTFTPPALHLPLQISPCRYILNFPAVPQTTRISLSCRKRPLPPCHTTAPVMHSMHDQHASHHHLTY